MVIPADDASVRRGLNFSGEQRYRAMSAASASAGKKQQGKQAYNKRRCRDEEHDAEGATPEIHKGIPVEVSELVAGVGKMMMDQVLPDLNQAASPALPDRVSGMNSFVDSSGASGRSATESFSATPPKHAR